LACIASVSNLSWCSGGFLQLLSLKQQYLKMSHDAILTDTFLSPVAHCQLNTETPNKLNLLHTLAIMVQALLKYLQDFVDVI